MENKLFYLKVLEDIEKDADQIQSQWSGEESGIQEDNAHIAGEIKDCVYKIRELIKELK